MDYVFSCVIPTHQRPEFLRQALCSVLEQTHAAKEIIVVSDVADPVAQQVCESVSLEGRDESLRFIHDPDSGRGASASRNRGAVAAAGEYLAFLDDDDLWQPSVLKSVVERFEELSVEMVVVCREIFSGDESHAAPPMVEGLRPRDVAAASLGTTGSKMFIRRDAFDRVGGFDADLPVKNDSDFFFRFLLSGGTYAVVESTLVRQRKHNFGQLTSKNEKRATGTLMYIEKHREHLKRRDIRKLRLSIHRIRRSAAGSFWMRQYHLLGALWNYSLQDFIRERKEWDMWHMNEGGR